MNKVLLHQKINISKLLLISFSSIMILIIYGCFKNGILLYQKGLISFFMIFRPIYFVLIPLAISIFIKYLKTKRIRIDFDETKNSYKTAYEFKDIKKDKWDILNKFIDEKQKK